MRTSTDWTGRVYPKDHDTTLDHPGRARFALGDISSFPLCDIQKLYSAANTAGSLVEFCEWLNNRALEKQNA